MNKKVRNFINQLKKHTNKKHLDKPPALPKAEHIFAYKSNNLVEMFEIQAKAVNCEFINCESTDKIHTFVQQLMQKYDWYSIHATNHIIYNILKKANVNITQNDAELLETKAAITIAEYAAARTGSIFVSPTQKNGRKINYYPETLIVVVFENKLKKDITDCIQTIKDKYNGNYPSMITMMTGPSRTADIEKTLILGAHGPKKLIIIYVNEILQN